MTLHDDELLESARRKLQILEEGILAAQQDTSGSPHVQELEVRSLKQLANQLKEEIARSESHGSLVAHSR